MPLRCRLARPGHPTRWLLASLCVLALQLLTGCVQSMVMDTARSLPEGETSTLAGFAIGYQSGAMLTYPEPDHPDWPEGKGGTDHESFPLGPLQLEWTTRWSVGAATGFQGDFWISAPLPAGLGGGLGLKWQVPTGPSRLLALALHGAANVSLGGNTSGADGSTLLLMGADAGAIVSLHMHRLHALYLSPRIRYNYLHARRWHEDLVAQSGADATSYAGAVGWQIGAPRASTWYLEAVAIYSPAPPAPLGQQNLRVTVGLGMCMP
jgi:hypothetical protein